MKIKLSPNNLKLGMYVSELDRPWVESPFIFQGFRLTNIEEIQNINSFCQYVYVDTEKSASNVLAYLKHTPGKSSVRESTVKTKTDISEKEHSGISESATKADRKAINESIYKASIIRKETRSYVDDMLAEARMGKIINTKEAKSLVAKLANNIIENTDASMWLTNLKKRDEYTAIHSVNVCVLSITFGRALGLKKHQLNELGLGALLHDLGKMHTPLEILNKPGKLTADEFEIMKSHPVKGYEILEKNNDLSAETLDIIKSHHERLNGSGYPSGLKNNNITYFTQLVSITDVYDAVTSDRVYHDGMTPHEALKNMYEWAPGNFNIELIQAFIRTIGIYPIGSLVELKSGHIGIVMKLNHEQRLKPILIMIMNRHKEYYAKRKIVNLASSIWDTKENKPEIHRIIDAKEYDIDVTSIIEEELRNNHN